MSAITHIRYVALGVRDLSAQVEFYRDVWGLEERESDADVTYFGAPQSADPHVLRLRGAPADRLDLISFAVPTAADVDGFARRLEAAGVRLVGRPSTMAGPGGGYGFRFYDLEGRTLEIAAEVAAAPVRRLAERDWHPASLSHAVINTPRLEETAAWYAQHLGLPFADRLADVMIFLRADNRFHHTLAIAAGPYVSVNHVAFEAIGLDEYLRAAGRLMRAGEPCVWGPGRHGPGDNTFAYFQDRSGFVVEYTTKLQIVDDWSTWEPTVHPMTPEWSDQWGTANTRNPEPFLGFADPALFTAPPR